MYMDLLVPHHFVRADEEEVLAAASLYEHRLRGHSCFSSLQQAAASITMDLQVGEGFALERAEPSAESGCAGSDSTVAVQTTTSEDMDEKLPRSFGITNTSIMLQEVYNTFGWRRYSVDIESRIHHFNWFGEPVYQRSSTVPADSLAIILAEPKVPESTGDMRVQALFRRAWTFLDVVVVALENAQRHLLLRRGSQLQQAVTNLTYKYYTTHGRWTIDAEEDPSKVAVDGDCIDAYLSPTWQWTTGSRNRFRSDRQWSGYRLGRRNLLLCRSRPPWKLAWKPRPFPLRQVMSASDAQPRLQRNPGR